MINYYCERIGLGDAEKKVLCDEFDRIKSNGTHFNEFNAACRTLLEGQSVKPHCEKLSALCAVNPYTVFELVLLNSLPALEHAHRINKYDPALFEGVLLDIKAKTKECCDVYGVVGIICYDWYIDFYNCKRACLGRIQLEKHAFKFDYKDFKQGDRAINCHIPSTVPLKYDDVIASFKWAYEYFGEDVKDGILPIVCNSWLLHPETAKRFKSGGGLEMFYNLFDVIYSEDHQNNRNFWRVFGVEFKDIDKAPTDTSLRRSLLDMIKSGQDMGSGYGVILFDGEKIVNK